MIFSKKKQYQHDSNAKCIPNIFNNSDENSNTQVINEFQQVQIKRNKLADITQKCNNINQEVEDSYFFKINLNKDSKLFYFEDDEESSEQKQHQEEIKLNQCIKQNQKHLFMQESSEEEQIKTELKKQRKEKQKLTENIYNESIKELNILQVQQKLGADYLFKKMGEGFSLDCLIRRDKNNSQYHVYDIKTFLPIFVITKNLTGFTFCEKYQQKNCLNQKGIPRAFLKTNFIGDSFNLFKLDKNGIKQSQSLIQINYEVNLFGFKGPRKMNIYVPILSPFNGENLDQIYEQQEKNNISLQSVHKYVNRNAKWNDTIKSYSMNLYNKAKFSSIKNFVIVKNQTASNYQVIFGKNGQNTFRVSITNQFSIMQSLAICISSFHRKITSQ